MLVPRTLSRSIAALFFTTLSLNAQVAVREFSTDRPDVTESAITVPKGRFQLESDLIGASEDRNSGIRSRSISVGGVNVKFGVHDRVDVQVITELWSRATSEHMSLGGRTQRTGMGDLTVRTKVNIWGNDGGRTALAVMPFIKLPTATAGLSNGAVEGGIIVPFATELPAGFSLGLMSEVDVLRKEAAPGYYLDVMHSAALGRDLFGPVAAYVELVGVTAPWHDANWRATGNGGVTVAVMPDVQLDFGANFGLTSGTDRVLAFVGLSFRR